MPEFGEDVLLHVSKLARLNLNQEELENFSKQLEDVLAVFEKISGVETENVDPAFHAVDLEESLREDEPESWNWDPLANTKSELKEDGYIKSPRIV